MKSNYLILSALSILVLSCTKAEQPLVYSYADNNSDRTAGMAQARGVNVAVMDKHLESLMVETSVIESQIQHLMGRLKSLRAEIGVYDSNPYETTVMQTKQVEMKPAKAEPQVILPVLEKKVVKAAPKPVVKKTVTAAKPKSTKTPSGKGVYNVRHGVHADKTRLVFDVNGSTKNTVAVDTEAGIVTITMPDTQWTASQSRMYNLNQLSGYEAKSSGQGTIIALAIKNTTDVKTMALSKPNRLVVDLMK